MAADYKEAVRILAEQEKILQFDSFTNEDAWKLGNTMVEEIRRQGIDLSVSIRKVNGHIVFAYASEGANLNHQNWTNRKFNMVNYMECSSLLATARAHMLGRTLEEFGLSYQDYKLCGGGFPVRVKNGGMTHVITASALAHEKDHAFIVGCLERFLDRKVPFMDMEIPML